jgi:ABC-type multidrug transport system fused ATPase/permease subunit
MPKEQPGDWALLRRLWAYLRHHRTWLWIVAITTPLGVLGGLVQPVLLKYGIDHYIALGTLEGLGLVALAFLGAVVLGFVARTAASGCRSWACTRSPTCAGTSSGT